MKWTATFPKILQLYSGLLPDNCVLIGPPIDQSRHAHVSGYEHAQSVVIRITSCGIFARGSESEKGALKGYVPSPLLGRHRVPNMPLASQSIASWDVVTGCVVQANSGT